ncbi:7-bladed beta-propeller protein YncE [Candidatus Pantoea multigeneris]|uniref:7-bladed beta-propeller protein YncE n=1 Tax=Candidatus Pantoea multigeneris TaxID=2608357 RepID=UPI001F041E5D|nr:YncE family protein [Pantoea multigeneris]
MKALKTTQQWALRPLLLATALFSASAAFAAPAADVTQQVGQGAYELAFSNTNNALYVATSNGRGEGGGVVYRLGAQDLAVQGKIPTELKTFGAAINNQTNVLYVGNTLNSAVTSVDVASGKELKNLVLDATKREGDVRPLAVRELAVDEKTNRVYITGLGKESVVWVVDGKDLKLISTIPNTGKMGTGIALDSAAQKAYVTNADGELVTIDTRTNAIEKRVKLDEGKDHFFLNIALDTKGQRAFITDSKQAQVLVVDLKTQKVIERIAVPESLAVLFNAQRDELYVTHRMASEVSIIDASNYKVKRTVKTEGLPNSLAISADGKALFVSVKQPGPPRKPAGAKEGEKAPAAKPEAGAEKRPAPQPGKPDSVLRIAL